MNNQKLNIPQTVKMVITDFDGIVTVSQADVHRIASDSESSPLEIRLGPRVERVHQLVQEACHIPLLAPAHRHCLRMEIFGVAYTVKAGNAGNHNHIPPSA